MSYEILEHTGDAKIRVRGNTKEELFRDAMHGMFALLQPKPAEKPVVQRTIRLHSSDVNGLLVDFLSEVNYLRQTHQEMYDSIEFSELSDSELEGELRGRAVEKFGEDIKAVTFHELAVKQHPQGVWETVVVFDV